MLLVAKIQVKNLKQLEDAVRAKLNENKSFASNLENKSAEIMSDRIKENVYEAYTPSEYNRRGDEGGFSDARGIVFTDVNNTNNGLLLKLENTNTGNDSMEGEMLTNMFENGIQDNWDNPYAMDAYGRIVSNERPFIDDTISDLKQNKTELVKALRKDLKSLGFDTR